MMKKYAFLFCIALLELSFHPGQPNEYGKWQMFYGLNHDDFIQTGTEQKIDIKWADYSLNPDQRKINRQVCFYAPDSAYFLDLYSNSFELNQEADGSLSRKETLKGSKAQLINTQGFSATALLDLGKDGFVETAFWRGQSWFVICGFTRSEKGEFVPTTWWYDLTKKTYTVFHNTKVFPVLAKSYTRDVKLMNFKQK